jgi:hypothetical protein
VNAVANERPYFVRDYHDKSTAYAISIRDDRASWAVHDAKVSRDEVHFSGFAIQHEMAGKRILIALATKNQTTVAGRVVPDWGGDKIFLVGDVAYAIGASETRIEFRDWVFMRRLRVLRRGETVFSILYAPPLLKEVFLSDGEVDQHDFFRFIANKTAKQRRTIDDLIS